MGEEKEDRAAAPTHSSPSQKFEKFFTKLGRAFLFLKICYD
jgi:hypothetical protein